MLPQKQCGTIVPHRFVALLSCKNRASLKRHYLMLISVNKSYFYVKLLKPFKMCSMQNIITKAAKLLLNICVYF